MGRLDPRQGRDALAQIGRGHRHECAGSFGLGARQEANGVSIAELGRELTARGKRRTAGPDRRLARCKVADFEDRRFGASGAAPEKPSFCPSSPPVEAGGNEGRLARRDSVSPLHLLGADVFRHVPKQTRERLESVFELVGCLKLAKGKAGRLDGVLVTGFENVGERPARVRFRAPIAEPSRALAGLAAGGAVQKGARRVGGAAEMVPEQRRTSRGFEGAPEVAEVDRGRGHTHQVPGLFDESFRALGVIGRAPVRGARFGHVAILVSDVPDESGGPRARFFRRRERFSEAELLASPDPLAGRNQRDGQRFGHGSGMRRAGKHRHRFLGSTGVEGESREHRDGAIVRSISSEGLASLAFGEDEVTGASRDFGAERGHRRLDVAGQKRQRAAGFSHSTKSVARCAP